MRTARRIEAGINYTLMVFFAVLFMFPWFWTMGTSLKTSQELYIYPPPFVPKVPQWSNYPRVFELVPFGRFMMNSIVVVALSSVGSVLSALVVAYSFARFRWRGRDAIFAITLATMMLPAEVTLIPQYLLFKYLGWLDTTKPLWVPSWFGGGAFSIFLIRQFIMTLPREFDEAATIDGANPIRILIAVLAPLMKPVLATVAVMSLIWGWNDFMGPLIYLTTPKKFTLALGLRYFQVTPSGQSWGMPTDHLLMASCIMATTPIIIVFFSAQRYFVRGIVMSGIKG
ncbi:MAG: carbohydrate ABC transporter permease [Chloroflexota bacterium]